MDFNEAEAAIGYTFKDKDILLCALTHKSYANVNHTTSYERLEFYGDSVLGYIITDIIFNKYKDKQSGEGYMSKLRQHLVSEEPLADAVERLGIDRYLLIAKNVRLSPRIKSNLFESILAAVYIDGGIRAARAFVNRTFKLIIEREINAGTEIDFKSRLQERTQKKGVRPEYIRISKNGFEHSPVFTVEVRVDGVSAIGEGTSIKAAEQAAAKRAIELLKRSV
ncbi:MAG: ribonuclease III [Clostridiales bacterium]|jgi:ribonuclease III|nr:ribonuclease III [Clostridiales bacterium]